MSDTRARILELLSATEAPLSGEAMGRELGVSRASIAKAIGGLRDLGYVIKSAPRVGHRLVARPDRLIPLEVTVGLETARLGRVVHAFEDVTSTQDIARGLAAQGVADGTVVVAERQHAGRGRMGREFVCPQGGIWSTVLLRGSVPARVAPLVSLAAGVAVARAVDDVLGVQTCLKWPNDVTIGGRKVAGILTEALAEEQVIHYLLVGAGINANFSPSRFPPSLRRTATTLAAVHGSPVNRRRLLQRYLWELERLWDRLVADDPASVLDAWRAHPNILGQRVRVDRWGDAIEGVATAVDDNGALLIEGASGVVTITAGDVRALPELVGVA